MNKHELLELFDTNKEDLSKLDKNKKRIRKIAGAIIKIHMDNSTKLTTSYNTSGNTNSFSSKTEKCIERKEEKIEELELEKKNLEEENKILEDRTQDVEIALKCLKFKERIVIEEHYIEGNSYEDIGNRIFWKLYGQTRSIDAIKGISKRAMSKMLKIMK